MNFFLLNKSQYDHNLQGLHKFKCCCLTVQNLNIILINPSNILNPMLSLLRQVLNQQQANLIFCMLISIPISYLLKLIKQKYLFLALSMTVTLAFQTFLFPTECYFLWVQQQIVYALILFAPRKHAGHYILIESFMALAAVQIRRIYISYGVNGVDITGIFMMQLFVWVGMGYNYQNGAQSPEKLTHDQKKRMIVQKPNYITYLGYVNFLPACLIGPVYQYRDYEDYLHRVNEYAHIPSPVKAMGKQALVFACTLIGYLSMSSIKADDLTTEWYAQQSLCYKFLYIQLIVLSTEFKYISAWSLGLISMKASGFTYNPSHSVRKQDGTIEHNFDKVRVTDFIKFFLNPSLKVKAQGWNISVQNALKKYIYQQIYNPTHTYHSEKQRKKIMNKAQMTTMITSALWHGFYLSYFITFFHWGMCLQISGQFYKFRSKHKKFRHIWEKYPILGMLQSLVWHYCIAYFGMAVPLLAWEKVKIYLAQTYYIPYIILYAGFILIIEMRVLSKLLPREQHAKEHTDGTNRHHQQGQQQLQTPNGQQHQQNQKEKSI